jgi:DNA repair protein RadC
MEPKLKPGRKFIDAGPTACSDAEILAILIGSGGPGYSALDCANSVLARFGTLPGIMGKPVRDLTQIHGINTVKAIKIAAAFELACRIVDHLGRDG